MQVKIYYKFVLILILLTGMFFAAKAQTGFHVGVDGALNSTFIINQNNYDGYLYEYAPTLGYTYGLAAGYNINNHIGFQVEVKGSKQGQYYGDKINGRDVKREVDLYYTHVPVLFKFSGGGEQKIRFYVMAGPQFSFLNRAQETFTGPDTFRTVNWTNRYNRQDLQLVFDLGSDISLGRNLYASTGLRFNYGLRDINAPAFAITDPTRTHPISQNALGGLHIGLHYMFGRNNSGE